MQVDLLFNNLCFTFLLKGPDENTVCTSLHPYLLTLIYSPLSTTYDQQSDLQAYLHLYLQAYLHSLAYLQAYLQLLLVSASK
jgi:hypothetical protein